MDMRDPDANVSKTCATLASTGKPSKHRLPTCVDDMVLLSGISTFIPGNTNFLSWIGAFDVTKFHVAPVSTIVIILDWETRFVLCIFKMFCLLLLEVSIRPCLPIFQLLFKHPSVHSWLLPPCRLSKFAVVLCPSCWFVHVKLLCSKFSVTPWLWQ